MRNKLNQTIKYLNKYNLKPYAVRDLTLLSSSCVALSWTNCLKEYFGIFLEAYAVKYENEKSNDLLNLKDIADRTEKLIGKLEAKEIWEEILIPAKKVFLQSKKEFKNLREKRNVNDLKRLKLFLNTYLKYLASLGIYNCFLWYIGDSYDYKKLSKEDVGRLGKERDLIAALYPNIEKNLIDFCDKIGKKNNFNGKLLRRFIFDEIENMTDLKEINKNINIVKNRNNFFVLYTNKNRHAFSIADKKIIKEIDKRCYVNPIAVKKIQGNPAYSGKTRGLIYNIGQGGLPIGNKKYILVASMTHPDHIQIIKNASAIVTDEGGVLCHAAIVAREMKKPCIIGTKFATKILKDGDLVEVDADKGIVKILKRK